MRKIHKYGWKKDKQDVRDLRLRVDNDIMLLRPPVIDYRLVMPEVYDQKDLGSCVANAVGAAMHYDMLRRKDPDLDGCLSRLFIYWNARNEEGTVQEDAGCQIRNGIKVIARYGAPSEMVWPYVPDKFVDQPPQYAYDKAVRNKVLRYARVSQTAAGLESCLAMGYPIACGIQLYESFESDAVSANGRVPLPSVQHEQYLGGHAILLVGYDRQANVFICRNSWGPQWGDKGYFYLPYEYVLNPALACDFWCVKMVLV